MRPRRIARRQRRAKRTQLSHDPRDARLFGGGRLLLRAGAPIPSTMRSGRLERFMSTVDQWLSQQYPVSAGLQRELEVENIAYSRLHVTTCVELLPPPRREGWGQFEYAKRLVPAPAPE